MKKLISLMFVTCMLLVSVCTVEAARELVHLEFGAAGIGSATFTNMAAFGEIINTRSDYIRVNVLTTAGSVAHYHLFREGAIQLGTGAGTTDHFAWEGGNEIFPEPLRDWRTIVPFSRTFQTVMVRTGSGLYRMSDLQGRRIAVGARAAPSSEIAIRTLSSLGITANIMHSTNAEQVELYMDGRADVYMLTSAAGNANVLNAMNTVDSRLISLTDEEVRMIMEGDLKGLSSPALLTNEMYDFIAPGEEITVMTEVSVLNVIADMDDQLVYDILDLFWSNHAELFENFRGFNTSPEDILLISSPVHPGAARFYRERFNIEIPAERIPR